jgi:hypothetical protein
MNSKAKGSGYEREVRDILQADGYKIFRCHRKPIFIKGKMLTMGADIFGCDIVAKKAGEKTRWIQVSTVENKSKKEKQIMEHPLTVHYETYELWLRIDGKKAFRRFMLEYDIVNRIFVWTEYDIEKYREAA